MYDRPKFTYDRVSHGQTADLKDPSIVDLTLVTEFLTNNPLVPSAVALVSYTLFTASTLYHGLYGIQKACQTLFGMRPFVQPRFWKRIAVGLTLWSAIVVLAVAGYFENVTVLRAAEWHYVHQKMYGLIGIAL